jgi:hypothetical protein
MRLIFNFVFGKENIIAFGWEDKGCALVLLRKTIQLPLFF